MTEQDVHDFSSSSPHRLPTTSATEALKNLSSTPRRPLSTRIKRLDGILCGRAYDASSQGNLPGGIARGNVTEVYGPPGVGKTSFALQVAADVLKSGESTVWVDTTKIIDCSRLKAFLSSRDGSDVASTNSGCAPTGLDALHHLTTPTLPHLLALLSHPSNGFPPPNTSLLVVDNVSTLFSLAFRSVGEKSSDQRTPAKKGQASQWASSRRWAVMDHLTSDLGRLAVTRNIAVLLVSQMTTRIHDDARAMLCPAITGTAWETGIATRIVLFRDWCFNSTQTSSQVDLQPGVCFAGVTKVNNISYEGVGRLAAFRIVDHGLEEIPMDAADIKTRTSPAQRAASLKRRYGQVADSESEDGAAASDHEFGWDGDEATLEAEGLVE